MIDFYRKMVMLGVLVFFCIIFIFSNSLKNGEESHKDSAGIVEFVKDLAEKIAPENQVDWNYIVRKSAHLFEFFVLGVFSAMFFFQWKPKRKYGIIYSFICVILIACTDEFIQRFTGRTSSFEDVMIDICGASIGIGFILLFGLWKKRIERNKNSNESADV